MSSLRAAAAVVVLTRDLRVRDNPALARGASGGGAIIPLFVLDPSVLSARTAAASRTAFLLDSLEDLRKSLRARGADLVVRRGDVVEQALHLAGRHRAGAVVMTDDFSAYARRRRARLESACRAAGIHFEALPGTTVVAPGAVRPAGGDHYRVFTPYWRAWTRAAWRPVVATPRAIELPDGLEPGRIPAVGELTRRAPARHLPPGGESAGRRRMDRWLRSSLASYGTHRDDLTADRTSRLGAYLHLGCISPRELAGRASEINGSEEFVRQLCWRDFFTQVTAAHNDITTNDYRPRGRRWTRDPERLEAWKSGRTGYPIVDAAMRQLAAFGWMHNRLRLVTAFFFTRYLSLDWRLGADHFMSHLVDGDIASNYGNWQWVAGTGNDTRPNRPFNVVRQARRYDPDGDYVRRFLPELSTVTREHIHEPWSLPPSIRRRIHYPEPIVV